MSAGLGAPSLLDGLTQEDIARLMRANGQQAGASPVDSLLFDRAGMGGGAGGFSGTSGTILQPPQAGARPAPEPRATGALSRAVPLSDDARPAPSPNTLAAPRAMPLPPARPAEFGGEEMKPIDSFDPLSGQPVSGSPKPLAQPASAPGGSGGLNSMLGGLFGGGNNDPWLSNTLLGLGAGILQGRTFGEGLGRGLEQAQRFNALQAQSDLASAKAKREQAALGGNAAILKRAYGLSDAEAVAQAGNSAAMTQALQILRDPTHGLPKTPERMQEEARASAAGAMEGSAKPVDRLQAEAQAQAAGTMAGNAKPLDRIEAEAAAQARGTQAGKPDSDEGGKLAAQIEVRRQKAAGLGLVEGSPAWQSFVGTGKIGRDQDLSATDKKAIAEGDDAVQGHRNTLVQLRRAVELSKSAYDGAGASQRAWAVSNIPGMLGGNTPESLATRELDNVVTGQALDSLKATFGGAPTEGERAILLQVQGSANLPQALREQIFRNAIEKVEKKMAFEQQRVDDLRGGTYYKAGGLPGATPDAAAPGRVTGAKRMRFDPTTGGFN